MIVVSSISSRRVDVLFSYEWVIQYLADAPTIDDAVGLLNATGLEAERSGDFLEIEHTVNRPDAMSHYGVARELAVKLGARLVDPPVYEAAWDNLDMSIESDDHQLCARYMGLLVENVRFTPSPAWLKERLEALGQTCHGLLVDLTNYLLWELGHPSHAFDADKIQGNRIRVRRGQAGESLTTLDGKPHEVEGFLCIADAERPIALAGVMGGENSEVTESTTRLLLELALFDPYTVRCTGRDLQIESDARHRFERGVDPEKMDFIVRRFAYLLQQEQPDIRIRGLADMNPKPYTRRKLTLRRSHLDRILGIHLADDAVMALLQNMDFQPTNTADGWQLAVPGYKVDVDREIDVIEEVIRFAGLDLLETSMPPGCGTDFHPDPLRDGGSQLRDLMVSFGYQETVTYAFTPESWEADLGQTAVEDLIALRNPMNKNQAVMRSSLLPSLANVVQYNLNRGIDRLALFEVSHVFTDGNEPHRLGAVLVTGKEKPGWWQSGGNHPFYQMKGTFQTLAARLGWQHILRLQEPAPAGFQIGEAVGIYWGETCIGGLGMLNRKLLSKWKIEEPVAAMECELTFLTTLQSADVQVSQISPYPPIEMDMAFVVDVDVTFGDIYDHIQSMDPPQLVHLGLFDIYQGKNLETNKKSLGFRFRFQSKSETLTQDAVQKTMDDVVESVKQRFGAIIRV